MAVTVIKAPLHLNLSKDPITYILETDKYVATAGAKTTFAITVGAYDGLEDHTLEFTFSNGITVVMTTKTTPDDSGSQIPKSFSGSVLAGLEEEAHAAAIFPYLKLNHTLRNNFNITYTPGSDTINFEAKEETDFTNISFDTNYIGFEWGSIDTTGVAPVLNENFFIGVDVFVEDEKNSGTYINAGTLFGAPDENNQVAFNLSKTLDPYLSNDFLPDATINAEICENNCKRFYLEYYEFYGSVPTEKAVTQSDTYLVLKGGLKYIDFYRSSSSFDFYTYYTTNKLFLTSKKIRRVNKTQKEFLYWFNNYTRIDVGGDPDIIYLRVKAYYTDGTTSEANGTGDPDSVNDDVVMFPCGYNELNTLTVFTVGKTVYKYEAWLQSEEAADIITEKITFWVYDADYLDKIFYYENQLGGMETLRTNGIHEFNSEVTSGEARRNVPLNIAKTTTLRQIYVINTTHRSVNIGRTGDVVDNQTESIVLREFFISEDSYAINSKGIIYAIIITPETRPESIDDDNLFGYEFEYKEAFINKGFSNY